MMDEQASGHPDPVRVAEFSRGILDHDQMAEVEDHLAVCELCRQVLSTLHNDEFVGSPRTAQEQSELATSPWDTVNLAATSPRVSDVPDSEVDSSSIGRGSGSFSDVGAISAPDNPNHSDLPEHSLERDLPPELANHPRYRIVKRLGIGGMGSVYLAEHRLMDRPVALKVIRRDLLGNEASVERFRREVKAAARLALHPNIVAAYDAEQAGDSHFLVMEFIDGVDLAHLVKSQGPLPCGPACEAVKQAAEGLDHADQRGMVHRDIKPHNLMRTPDGQVKILDFGLARFASEALPDLMPASGRETDPGTTEATARDRVAPLTFTDMVLGTADYIAPEQALDPRSADIRADIYSLGCTLYYLLAGHPPFPGGSLLEKLKAHREQAPRPLHAVRPELPPELTPIVDRMMAKDRSLRFQRPSEVAEALKPFADAGAIREATTNVAAGGDAEAIEVAAASTVAETSGGQPQPKPTGSPSVRRRRPRMRIAAILVLLIASVGTLGIIKDFLSPDNEPKWAYYWLSAELLTHLGFLLSLLFLVYVFKQQRSPSSRLAWVLVILLLPYVGVPLYLVLRNRRMRRRARRLVVLLLPYLGVPLGMVLGERKMRRLVRWRERAGSRGDARAPGRIRRSA
jgi:serine/threonine protein kinase